LTAGYADFQEEKEDVRLMEG